MATGQHLTQKQISAWMVGERPSEAIQHMRSCSACEAEVLLFGTTLLDFRGAVREWSRENTTSAVIPGPAIHDRPIFSLNRAFLVMAAAMICVLAGVSWRMQHSPAPAVSAISDRALMSQVDDQISRTVPTAMEPLLQLVEWQRDGHADASEPVSSGMVVKENAQGAAN
ncbi:MAG TPA: hypothetical protein VHZ07_11970 [Bryobacteraceae bacterium]|jgi:hypothetical protein|nr:hypothetical protein [Bryobacteraceae bacterium]